MKIFLILLNVNFEVILLFRTIMDGALLPSTNLALQEIHLECC